MKSLLIVLALLAVSNVTVAQRSYEWVNLNSVIDTSTNSLKEGAHKIILKKTRGEHVSHDTISFHILPDSIKVGFNYFPIADAGRDTTFKYGVTGLLTGSGKDFDGKIVSYKWKKLSGPRQGKISYSTRAITTLTNLDDGEYIYQLTITDDKGGIATDTVTVRVRRPIIP